MDEKEIFKQFNDIHREMGKINTEINHLCKEKDDIKNQIEKLNNNLSSKIKELTDSQRSDAKEIKATIKSEIKEVFDQVKIDNKDLALKVENLINEKNFWKGGWKVTAAIGTALFAVAVALIKFFVK